MTPKWIKISAAAFLLIVACGASYIGFGAWRDLRKSKVPAHEGSSVSTSTNPLLDFTASPRTQKPERHEWSMPCELSGGIYHCGGRALSEVFIGQEGSHSLPANPIRKPGSVPGKTIEVLTKDGLRWVDPPKIEDSYVREGNTWRLADRTDIHGVQAYSASPTVPVAGQVVCPPLSATKSVFDCAYFDGTGWKKLPRGSEQ